MSDDRELPPSRIHAADAAHHVAYDDLVALVRKHADKMTSMELLAIAANVVGKLVAMQDQTTVSPAMAMEVVARNIQLGNHEVLAKIAAIGGTPH